MSENTTFGLQYLPIEQVRLNDTNPRLIKDARFEALKQSIQAFPAMLTLRPLVVDEHYTVLGGNMRLQALLQLRYPEVPVLIATGLTDQQKREFIIKDNASFGEWDWDLLANEWSDLPLPTWLDVPRSWGTEPSAEEEKAEATVPEASIRIAFSSLAQAQQAHVELQQLLEQNYPGATLTLTA